MTWSPDSSITGGTITGYTSPTFTQVDDIPPAVNARQKTVTSLGGVQGTATANSASKPFTATFYKPQALRVLPAANPLTGLRGAVPNNQYRLVVRKGGLAAADVPVTAVCRITFDIPAGMDNYNADEIKSMVSYVVGLLTEESNDLAETLYSGVVA
jgi:hypothetical protein